MMRNKSEHDYAPFFWCDMKLCYVLYNKCWACIKITRCKICIFVSPLLYTLFCNADRPEIIRQLKNIYSFEKDVTSFC
jgi:hypothetical protein